MNIALVLSGGTGTRLGTDVPKQYLEVCGKPILIYCLETLCCSTSIDGIQIVAALEWQETVRKWLEEYHLEAKFKGFSLPGENRQLSIFNGLQSIREYTEDDALVLIHDAARPNLSPELVESCFRAIEDYDGVLPVLPMKDTVYLSEDGKQITSLLKRSQVYAGQAPELFRLGSYLRANEALLPEKILEINGSTEPAVLADLNVAVIPGDERNFKITTQADLERFKEIVHNN